MADQKWNLGDIRPAAREPKTRRKQSMTDMAPRSKRAESGDDAPTRPTRRQKPTTGGSGGLRRTVIFGGVIILLAIIGFVTTLLLRSAEVVVYPKFKDVTVQASFSAHQSPSLGELGYELLTLDEIGERVVDANGEEEVEDRAEGTITIYNAYSPNVQRLIKNTRFASADGHIFRIDASVEVPGYKKNTAGEIVPGSTTAHVFADNTGAEYNVDAGKFTIPGLKGSDQYETMYAQSDAPMRGGFVGTMLTVADDDLTTAQAALHDDLRTMLMERLQNERPAGFELYDSAVRIRFESLPSTDAGEGKANIHEKGILEVPIFKESDFAEFLAGNTIAGYEGEPVVLENPQTLTFAYATDTSTTTEVAFTLAGNTRIVWDYDENQLRTDVAGVAKTALPSILSKYPAIMRAEAVVKPFWKQSFPDDAKNIKITEILSTK